MSRRTCSVCGKQGHNKRTCPSQNKICNLVSGSSSGPESQTDSENAEPTVIPATQSPKSTPTKDAPKRVQKKTPPEAKEIMDILNSDTRMLDEMTAEFEFDPAQSSAGDSTQPAKADESDPQKSPTSSSKKSSSSNIPPERKQPKESSPQKDLRQLPPRSARTQAAEKISKQLKTTAKPKKVELPLRDGSCGATSRPSRRSKSGARTPSPHQTRVPKTQQQATSWRQRAMSGMYSPKGKGPRATLYHSSVSPPRPTLSPPQPNIPQHIQNNPSPQPNIPPTAPGYTSPPQMMHSTSNPRAMFPYAPGQHPTMTSPQANPPPQPFHMTPPYQPYSPPQLQPQFHYMQPQFPAYFPAQPMHQVPPGPAMYAQPPRWNQPFSTTTTSSSSSTTAAAAGPNTPATVVDSPVRSASPSQTKILRPDDSTLVQLHNQQVNTVFAVAWQGGGGIYVAEAEANPARFAMLSIGKQVSVVLKLNDPSKDIFANFAEAEKRIQQWNTSASPARERAQRESDANTPSSASAAEADATADTTARAGTPQSHHSSSHLSSTQPTPQSYNKPATPPPPPLPTSTALTPSPPATAKTAGCSTDTDLLSETEWAFSQEDQLVRKHLFSPGLKPFSHGVRQPDPNKIQYIAPPGSSRGIIVSDAAHGMQRIVMDADTGTMMVKPKHMATLRLLEFHTFLSLMFRAVDMASQGTSAVHKSAVPAIQNLIRKLIRQYEAFRWASEPAKIWEWVAYLSWTHLVLTRTETSGFQWEAAFEREARARVKRGTLTIAKQPASREAPTNSVPSHLPRSNSASSHWFICPCCAAVNDHFSPTCPTQADGPTAIPKKTITKTRQLINSAPISQTAKTNLLKMTENLVAKLNS